MRIMTSDRLRLIVATLQFDNMGRFTHKKHGYYSGYHQKDFEGTVASLGIGEVLLVNYKHGLTLTTVRKIVKQYPMLNIHVKLKLKKVIISRNNDNVALELVRKIIKEDLWKLV